MAELISISIDGNLYRVDKDKNLLETCLNLGIDLSYFCWHPAMGSVGSCRQCAVLQFQDEQDTRGRLVMACMTPLTDNMLLSVDDEKAKAFRATNIEALMTNHPHDCPVCEEGGDCHLQDMTLMSGHISRRYEGNKRTHNNQYLGPLINHEMNRCIGCYRCVRFYRDYCNGDDLNVFGSKNQIYFGRAEPGILESDFSGNLAEICPTGVFTDKTFSEHFCRKWDLQSSPTVCHHCSLGCNTYTGTYNKVVRKITNRYNRQLNTDFLCDKGRFSYQYANNPLSVSEPLLRNLELKHGQEISAEHGARLFKQWLVAADGDVIALGSSRTSIENNGALLRLLAQHRVVGANFYADCSDQALAIIQHQLQLYQQNGNTPCTLTELESADCVLIIGEDVSNTAPRLALCLRQMVRNHGIANANALGIAQWQDHAVRNLAQELKSPLFVIGHSDSKLSDVARVHQIMTLEQQELLLTQVKHHLMSATNQTPSGNQAQRPDDQQTPGLAETIANSLLQSQRPAFVWGSSYSNLKVVQLINELNQILLEKDIQCLNHFVPPSANSLALAILSPYANGLDSLLKRLEESPPKMLLILEADLDWLCSSQQAQTLFQQCFEKIEHVVVIDHLMTPTAQMADLLLPAASAAEQQGCWLNSSGEIQVSYASMAPNGSRLAGWQWCQFEQHDCYNTVLDWCCSQFELLAPMIDCQQAQHSPFKLARQSFRASGRTAINANIDVKEYPPASDPQSVFKFSMEGVAPFRQQHSDIKTVSGAYIWQPKWNSGQGANKNNASGVRANCDGKSIFGRGLIQQLVPPDDHLELDIETGQQELEQNIFTLMPLEHFYNINELSYYCPSLSQLINDNIVKLNQQVAKWLNWQHGNSYSLKLNNRAVSLSCYIEPNCPMGVLLISSSAYQALNLNSTNSKYSLDKLQLNAGASL